MTGEKSWAEPILQALRSGVDVTQIEERLRLSPEERLQRMQDFLTFLDGFDCRRAE